MVFYISIQISNFIFRVRIVFSGIQDSERQPDSGSFWKRQDDKEQQQFEVREIHRNSLRFKMRGCGWIHITLPVRGKDQTHPWQPIQTS